MLEIRGRVTNGEGSQVRLTLPFEARQRSRQRVRLSSGEEALLVLPRGTVLRGGDTLALSDGRRAVVEAEPETVSTVRARDARRLARAAYHLGNRHVALEVGDDFVRYLHDHVLDGLVRELGLTVRVEEAPFEPEGGAYARHSHGTAHSQPFHHAPAHEHAHAHAHDHNHAHAHAHDHDHEPGGVREGGRGGERADG